MKSFKKNILLCAIFVCIQIINSLKNFFRFKLVVSQLIYSIQTIYNVIKFVANSQSFTFYAYFQTTM